MNPRLTVTAAVATILASTALFPLIMGGNWFWSGIGAVIVVAATGTATRMRAVRWLPAAACLILTLVTLVLYLNMLYAAHFSFLGVVPTGASLTHLGQLARQGLHDTHRLPPPVPPYHGILILATSGIGGMAAVTDLIAVRLRRCALAGLPLLALFSVPVAAGATKNALGSTIVFCLGMIGYLALLGADGRERLRLWGRLVTPWKLDQEDEGEHGPNTRALAASGRRIGLAAVALAILAPLLVPGLSVHKIFKGAPDDNGKGTGTGGAPNPLVQMNNELREAKPTVVLNYISTDRSPQNLQTSVLSDLSTNTWKMTLTGPEDRLSRTGGLPAVPGLAGSSWTRDSTQVSIRQGALDSPNEQSYLPLPYPARVLNTPGGWEVNQDTLVVHSPTQSLSGLSYTVTGYNVNPTPQQFTAASGPPAGMGSYLTVPAAYSSLKSYAKKITKGASTPYTRALALQRWFHTSGGFTYSLNTPEPSNPDALKNFLFHTKSGYCQQFAFAMAVLARQLGIPSRVAVGFTPGTSLGHGRWQVKSTDAHAWPELYFTGLGWLPWEPTPTGTAVGQGTAVAPAYSIPPGQGADGTTGSSPGIGQPGTTLAPNAQGQHLRGPNGSKLTDQEAAATQGAAGSIKRHHPGSPIPLLVIAGLLAVALIGPRITRTFTRRQRWLAARDDTARANAAWLELLDDLADHGIRHGPGETPRAVARRIAASQRLAEPARQALRRLAQAQERACYAREPGSSETLRADVMAVRSAVSGSVSRTARWQARLMPASVVDRARAALSTGLDAFGWAEVATTRVRGRLQRARAAGPG